MTPVSTRSPVSRWTTAGNTSCDDGPPILTPEPREVHCESTHEGGAPGRPGRFVRLHRHDAAPGRHGQDRSAAGAPEFGPGRAACNFFRDPRHSDMGTRCRGQGVLRLPELDRHVRHAAHSDLVGHDVPRERSGHGPDLRLQGRGVLEGRRRSAIRPQCGSWSSGPRRRRRDPRRSPGHARVDTLGRRGALRRQHARSAARPPGWRWRAWLPRRISTRISRTV